MANKHDISSGKVRVYYGKSPWFIYVHIVHGKINYKWQCSMAMKN
jgi:hypothetical protein